MSVKDLTGQKFGRLTALYATGERKYNKDVWMWKCDCGKEKRIIAYSVTSGRTRSCGCLSADTTKKRSFKDLTGKRFGRLVAIKVHHNTKGKIYWLCSCDCGKEHIVLSNKLISGNTVSCGCRVSEIRKDIENVNKSHSMAKTRIYRIHSQMKGRCYRKSCPNYESYGGRGITVCDEWIGEDGFINFYNWSINNGYSDELTIDRINNDQGYYPENCRWVTAKKQANNTRSTVFLSYNGETKTASEWSEITGIRRDTITRRKRDGWTDEQCLTIPVETKKRV